MAIRSFRVQVSDGQYTKIADNSVTVSIIENYASWLRIVVTDVGDPQPSIEETNFILCNSTYERSGDAVDVWVAANEGVVDVSGETV